MSIKLESMFKIKNKEGLFSKGGYNPYFSKRGKVWVNKGGLSNHLVQIAPWSYLYQDIVIVEIMENSSKEYPIEPYVFEKLKKYFNKNPRELERTGVKEKMRALECFCRELEKNGFGSDTYWNEFE